MGAGFEKYMEKFKPYLFASLDSHEETQLCIAAIGVVSDLCRAFEGRILPLMDEVMAKLLDILQVGRVLSWQGIQSRTIKILAFRIIG